MASSDYWLEIEEVKTEFVDQQFPGAIPVISFQVTAANDATFSLASPGGGKGRVHLSDISFSKVHDKTSATLLQFCCTGKHFKEAKLHCRKQTGDDSAKGLEYLTIKLTNCMVSNFGESGSQGAEVMESFSLAYKRIDFETKTQDETGKEGAGPKAHYDNATGEAG